MKTRIARVAVLSVALLGLAVGPAAAAAPSLELPTPITQVSPSNGGEASIQLSPCALAGWLPWCPRNS